MIITADKLQNELLNKTDESIISQTDPKYEFIHKNELFWNQRNRLIITDDIPDYIFQKYPITNVNV